MATSVNDITGNLQKTKGSNDAYRDGWDRIFARSTTSPDVSDTVVEQPVEQPVEQHMKPSKK